MSPMSPMGYPNMVPGMQPGVQYMPCVVSMQQLSMGYAPRGAVPVGLLPEGTGSAMPSPAAANRDWDTLGESRRTAGDNAFAEKPQTKPSKTSAKYRASKSPSIRQTVERAQSVERATYFRRQQSVGPPRTAIFERKKLHGQLFPRSTAPIVQMSEFWQQDLECGARARCWLVADADEMADACDRLNSLDATTLTSVDARGTAHQYVSGSLSLLQIAFNTKQGFECFMFDATQLGHLFDLLRPFLENADLAKIVNDSQVQGKLLAQQFGITMAGAIDTKVAYEELNSKPPGSVVDIFEHCALATESFKDESTRMESAFALWAQRPLLRNVLMYGVSFTCLLHAAGRVLGERLSRAAGPAATATVATVSQQKLEAAALLGWAQRQHAGLKAAEEAGRQGPDGNWYWAQASDRPDPELSDWLAKRFTAASHCGTAATNWARSKDAKTLPLPSSLCTMAGRPGDSPRTTEWRAAVVTVQQQSSSRLRSSSPRLQNWLELRTGAKAQQQQHKPQRRAVSMPPISSSDMKDEDEEPEVTFAQVKDLMAWNIGENKKAWAEVDDDDDEEGDDVVQTKDTAKPETLKSNKTAKTAKKNKR